MESFMTSKSWADAEAAAEARPVAHAAWHALLWLAIANTVGVLLAVLLLAPGLNPLLGEWTYGRWMMVHMNLELYGWTSLPLVGFLFRIYGADRGAMAKWCRPMLWLWSAALAVGALSWLAGHSSGRLFLDWSGYARLYFCGTLLALWVFLLAATIASRRESPRAPIAARLGKAAGLAALLAVPFVLYAVSGPGGYPPVNPSTGGPTGASQLESSLAIVLILLMLPFALAPRKQRRSRAVAAAWIALAAEALLCASLGRGDVSHRQPAQYLSLASLLVWIPLVPVYYGAFAWNPNTRLWRGAFQAWWAALVVTGWIFFLPGVLDHFKFTDGLVGHSFVAMAGFTSSLVVFVLVQMLGEEGWILNRARAFYLWHVSVIAYVLLMTVAGWYEGFDPAFTIVPGTLRNVLYALRLLTGVTMLAASLDWLADGSALLRQPLQAAPEMPAERLIEVAP